MSKEPQPSSIRRRLVFHLAGYETADPTAHHRWFVRELARFGHTWNVHTTASPAPEISSTLARWEVTATGPNWRCETSYRVLRWDDIVRHEMGRHPLGRLWRSLVAFVDFVRTGTVTRYFSRFWPFGAFFCFSYFMLPLFAAVAASIGLWLGGWLGLLVGGAILLGLYLGPGSWWRVVHALDSWCFAHTYVHRRHPATTQRMADFSRLLAKAVSESDADEILLVGHSFGTLLALEVLTQALALNPDFGRARPAVHLLTVGSTIPYLALHPGGTFLREHAATIALTIDWAEYQASDDPLNFYKVDPVSMNRRRDYPPGSRPMVRRVHVREMLAPETYRRFRYRWVRLHYQFLMANDVRTRYDYYMFACGPVSFSQLVGTHNGPLDFIAADGHWQRDPAG